VRSRVKALVSATASLGLSPLLPAAAVVLITLFAMSLAVAEPRLSGDLRVLAARGTDDAGTPDTLKTVGSLANDSIGDNDTAILSAPLAAPHYHDRYRFYHRYDLYSPRSRFSPLDDGVN
jgi:hypothetical protein